MNMSINTKIALAFISGAAAGVAASWYVLKTKYEQIAQEEIDQMREYYWDRMDEDAQFERGEFDIGPGAPLESGVEDVTIENISEEIRTHVEEVVAECEDIIKKARYTNYSDIVESNNKDAKGGAESMVEKTDKPYVIPPEEFGEFDDYETISLTYYADKVLADDLDELVEDVDNVVGLKSLETFGEYEDDSVFVRNDRLRADYEILLDTRNYSDVAPSPVSEDE